MLTQKEAKGLIEDSHLNSSQILNLLKAAVPELIENNQWDELHTLLNMSIDHLSANLEGIGMGMKYYHPSSVQKLT